MDTASRVGIFLGVLALGVAIAAWVMPNLWLLLPRWVSRAGLALSLVLILTAFACLMLLPTVVKPEVTLRFVHPEEPAIQLVNISESVATNVKWMVVVFNLDRLSERRDPLPIPASVFDLITSKNATIPIRVFLTPLVAPFIGQGNRIFARLP